MDTQTQIDRLIELAIIQRTELKQLVEQLPQLREHLNAEVERTFEEAEPQIRTELEEFVTRQAADKTATLGVALEAKIGELAKSLEESAQAKYSALIATRDQNATLLAQAEERIAAAAGELPAKVKDIVAAELARFPRAGEIDQLRKEFAEPKSLNPRGKWQADQTYNKLDLVTINGDSYTSNIDGNRTRPSRSSADWTLVAARGTGGGGGPTSLSELTTVPSNGDILIGSGTSWVTSNLTAGAGISITVGAGEITISATDGDITLDDGTAASPSLHFTNDADTGLYRPAANTLGISTSGVQRMYVDENGITTVGSGATFDGSVHAANGNANNPSFSFTSDQDTGMYRHGTNELGFTIGGTEKAVLTSTTFTITPNLIVSGTGTINGTSIPASKTLVVTTDKLSALASTSSSELAGVISDETGTGSLVFANTPTLVTPNIGAATGTSVNLSGAGTFGGNLTVSGGTGTIDATSGTASATLNLVGRSSGTAKTASVIANSSGSLVLGAEGAGSSLTIAANTGNTTVAYNLTVSGTGVSSVAGNVLVGTTTDNSATFASARTGVAPASSGSTSTAAIRAVDVSNDLALDIGVNSSASPYPGWIQVHGRTNQATNYPLSLNPNGGVVLVNTSANSGNGAIQLATHITSAGGIGFGTDVSLYRKTAALVALNGSGGAKIDFHEGGTLKGGVGSYAGSVYLASDTTSPILCYTNGSLALTLDSSQGATLVGQFKSNSTQEAQFAGAIRVKNALVADAVSAGFLDFVSGASRVVSYGADNSTAGTFSLVLRSANSSTNVTAISATTTAVTLGAALKLNNAYVAGAPTANGYVTLQDSGGNTVQVLVYKP